LIGQFHGRILLAAEHLNHRLWNLQENQSKGWLSVNGSYDNPVKHYYFTTTTYRFLFLIGCIRLFESEALFIDSRIAKGNELSFLKFVKSLEWALTDVALFNGLSYDDFNEKDHLFTDNLRLICEICTKEQKVISQEEFHICLCESDSQNKITPLLSLFDGLCADEERLRWDRIVAFHLLLMAFVNTFGYDMQRSSPDQFKQIAKSIRHNEVLHNLDEWLQKLGLSNEKEVAHISDAIKSIEGSAISP
jgi:hypothetical protein